MVVLGPDQTHQAVRPGSVPYSAARRRVGFDGDLVRGAIDSGDSVEGRGRRAVCVHRPPRTQWQLLLELRHRAHQMRLVD
jgi:hypothetical protein